MSFIVGRQEWDTWRMGWGDSTKSRKWRDTFAMTSIPPQQPITVVFLYGSLRNLMELRYSINSSAHWTADSWICWRVWLKIIQHISSWFFWHWCNYPNISPTYLLDWWSPKYPIHTAGPWQRTGRGVYQLLTCFATFWRHHRVPRWVGVPLVGPLVRKTVHGIRARPGKKEHPFLGVDRCWSYWPQPIQHPSTHCTNPVGRRGFTLRFRDQSPRVSIFWNHQLYCMFSGSEFSPEMKRWIVWGQTNMTNLVPNDMLPHPNWCFGFEGLVGWDNTRTNMYDKEQMIAGNGIGTSKHWSNQYYLHSLFQFVGSHLRNEIPTLPGMFFEINC